MPEVVPIAPWSWNSSTMLKRDASPKVINVYSGNCNAGHLYTEELPNILFFESIQEVCNWKCGEKFGLKKMIEFLVGPERKVIFKEGMCEEEKINSPGKASCFFPYYCTQVTPHREFSLVPLRAVYHSLLRKCGVKREWGLNNPFIRKATREAPLKVAVVNRPNRGMTNVEKLVAGLRNVSNLVVTVFTTADVERVTLAEGQCGLFRLYEDFDAFVVAYGTDLITPMILEKPTLSVIASKGTDGFFETMKHLLYYNHYFAVFRGSEHEFLSGKAGNARFRSSLDSYRVDHYLNSASFLDQDLISNIVDILKDFVQDPVLWKD